MDLGRWCNTKQETASIIICSLVGKEHVWNSERKSLGIIRKKHLYIDAELTEESFRTGRDGLNPTEPAIHKYWLLTMGRFLRGFGMAGGFELMEKLCHVRFPEWNQEGASGQSCLNDWLGKNVVNGIRSEQELELVFIFALEYWFFKNCGEINLKLNHDKVNTLSGS